MLLADTHLLGWRQGHWFDKLRREWQMERAFQTSLFLHRPQVVIILGDLFDEGKWADDFEFRHHLARFRRMFRVPDGTRLLVVAGNHDIGFHYDVTQHKVDRFEAAFHLPAVQLVSIGGVNFVLANSVAFEGDGCFLCRRARVELAAVSNRLRCAFGIRLGDACSEEALGGGGQLPPATAPILLTHYPLARLDESACDTVASPAEGAAAAPGDSRDKVEIIDGEDSAPAAARQTRLRPRWDCLSAEASDTLAEAVRPRLAFVGHTHWSCRRRLSLAGGLRNLTEYTLPSFSWRNINSPSFLLLTVSGGAHSVAKCRMPRESTVIGLYTYGVPIVLLWFLWPCLLSLAASVCWHCASFFTAQAPWRQADDKHL
ncbi:hypothetical protein BOX15_Mlig000731g1 [Macrostomum lignano]|nr:hypothetical protein BOX15_Mlig000731g1 [Macrostomum lignano]